MVFLESFMLGVKCLSENTITPETIKVIASIPRVMAAPYASIKNPAEAAPRINPLFVINAFIALAFCNPSFGTIVGMIPVKAGQNIPQSNP
jgi:hypothetical protein